MSIFTQEHYDAIAEVVHSAVSQRRHLEVGDICSVFQKDNPDFDANTWVRESCGIQCPCAPSEICPRHVKMLETIWHHLSTNQTKWREPLIRLQDSHNIRGVEPYGPALWEQIRSSSTQAIEAMYKLVTGG